MQGPLAEAEEVKWQTAYKIEAEDGSGHWVVSDTRWNSRLQASDYAIENCIATGWKQAVFPHGLSYRLDDAEKKDKIEHPFLFITYEQIAKGDI